MSIFKESFPYYVKKQIFQRGKVLSQGWYTGVNNQTEYSWNIPFGSEGEWDQHLVRENPLYLLDPDIGLGRDEKYFAYTLQKKCVVRMTSGVRLDDWGWEHYIEDLETNTLSKGTLTPAGHSGGMGGNVSWKWRLESCMRRSSFSRYDRKSRTNYWNLGHREGMATKVYNSASAGA